MKLSGRKLQFYSEFAVYISFLFCGNTGCRINSLVLNGWFDRVFQIFTYVIKNASRHIEWEVTFQMLVTSAFDGRMPNSVCFSKWNIWSILSQRESMLWWPVTVISFTTRTTVLAPNSVLALILPMSMDLIVCQ